MPNEQNTLDYLPVKFDYLSKRKEIRMYYRRKGSHKLFTKDFPYEHYVFSRVGNLNDLEEGETVYRHIKNGEWYKKEMIDPYTARRKWRDSPDDYAEGDVPPETRFVVDRFWNVSWPADIKPRIFYYDIETEIVGQDLPSFTNNKSEITAFTIYDNYTETYYLRALVPPNYRDRTLSDLHLEIEKSLEEYEIKSDVKLVTEPIEIIEEILYFFETMTPDIVTSWNAGFDLNYTVRKIFDHLGEKGLIRLSPFGKIHWKVKKCLETNEETGTDALIPGIDVIDDLLLYKKETDTEKTSYSLNSVATNELGEGKLQYDTDFYTLYNENFIYFCKYNLQDVRVMVKLEKKMKIIDLAISVRNLAKCGFDGIFYESYSIDNLCLMRVNRLRDQGKLWVLPSKPTVPVKEDYIGAYVKPTIKGRFRWVGDLDYKSEYPSEFVTWGVSNESMVGMIENFQPVIQESFSRLFPELDRDEIVTLLMPNFGPFTPSEIIKVKPCPMYKDIKTGFESFDEFRDWCIENKFEIMANGLIIDSKVEEPFLGTMAGEVMDLRDEHKVLMKKYDAEGNEEMALVYNISNKAIKTINNSIYGVCAASSFRLYDLRIAEAITSTGQCIIRSSTYVVNRFMNKLIKKRNPDHDFRDVVLTNDTDSIIFTVEDLVKVPITCQDVETFKKIVAVINLSQAEVNREIKNICHDVFFVPDVKSEKFRMFIKNEWVASSGLFLAKKGYALNIVFKEGYPKSEFKVAGLSLKKSSTPKAMQEFLANVVKGVLRYDSKESLDDMIMGESVRIKSYNYEDIACPTGVNGIDSYEKTTPIHVRGARVFNKYFAKSKKDWILSEKVKYLYVGKWLTVPELNIEKEYVISIPTNRQEYWEELPKFVVPDYPKLRKKLIVAPIEKIYAALGWEIPSIERADIKSSFAVFKRKKPSQMAEVN